LLDTERSRRPFIPFLVSSGLSLPIPSNLDPRRNAGSRLYFDHPLPPCALSPISTRHLTTTTIHAPRRSIDYCDIDQFTHARLTTLSTRTTRTATNRIHRHFTGIRALIAALIVRRRLPHSACTASHSSSSSTFLPSRSRVPPSLSSSINQQLNPHTPSIPLQHNMPPAAAAKPTRSSIYGWSKKRSVSPAAPTTLLSKTKPAATMSISTRRTEDSPFHEDDYREDIQVFMHFMDVSNRVFHWNSH